MTLAATPPGSVLAELERLNSSTGGSKLHQAGAPELSCWLDEDKKLSYSYNVLGLVDRFTVTASPRVGEATSYCYCADGTQIDSKRESAGGAVQEHILYFEGARYNGATNSFYVSNPAGATLLSATNDAQHIFFESDHLGNIMLAYSDLNGDDYIQPRDEVLEGNRYFLYGLKQAPYTKQLTTLPFGYNGAEWKDKLGLHLTTYRTLAPEVAMWGQVDLKAELMYGYSPYNSMGGNPISYNDPEGDWIHLAIGAVVGAGANVWLNWDHIASEGGFGSGAFCKAAGIGAGAGLVTAATGGAAAGTFGTAGSLGAAIGQGAVIGAAGGSAGGFVQGAGNALAFQDADLGQALGEGMKGDVIGGFAGAATGGLIRGIGYAFRPSVPGAAPDLQTPVGSGPGSAGGAGTSGISWGTVNVKVGGATPTTAFTAAPDEAVVLTASRLGSGSGNAWTAHGGYSGSQLKYVGIISRAVSVRGAEHLAGGGARATLSYRPLPNASGLSKDAARVFEQNVINQYGLPNLYNRVNSIAPLRWSNPRFIGIVPPK